MSRQTHNSIFNDEQRQFIRDNYIGISSVELTNKLNEKFDANFNVKSIQNFKANNGLKSGARKGRVPHNKGKKMPTEIYERTKHYWYQKGNIPKRNKTIGSERIVKNGYVQVKITDEQYKGKANWKLKHHLIYEQHYGPIPEGMVVTFVDGDVTNYDPENLVALTTTDLVWLNKHKMKFKDRELLESSIALGRLSMAVNKKKRERKKKC